MNEEHCGNLHVKFIIDALGFLQNKILNVNKVKRNILNILAGVEVMYVVRKLKIEH